MSEDGTELGDDDDLDEDNLDGALVDGIDNIGNAIAATLLSTTGSEEDDQGRNLTDAVMDVAKAINRLATAFEDQNFIRKNQS